MSIANTVFGAEGVGKLLDGKNRIFFIGIGGVSMRCLAHIAKQLGRDVGGSDMVRSAATDELQSAGIDVKIGHSAKNVRGYDAVVYTVAIPDDNPEYLAAGKLGMPRISRADFLGWLMSHYKDRIGVAGMHGKSTTTSMIAEVFMAHGDPTVVSGAPLRSMGGCYRCGKDDSFIFEACEYMDSFLSLLPSVAVVLNIDLDHTDYFASLAQVKRSYAAFLDIAADGVAVLNADDANVSDAAEGYRGKRITYGTRESAYVRGYNIALIGGMPSFDVSVGGRHVGHISLRVFGDHNVYNALASVAVALNFGIPFETIAAALAGFTGAERRMQYVGMLNGAAVYDDYAHHPTEITATLRAAKKIGSGRLWCVFQPHTYSRTKELYYDFAEALKNCDQAILTDIYAARETDDLGVSSEMLARDSGPLVTYAPSFEAAADILTRSVMPGDTVVIMGAGNVMRVADHLDIVSDMQQGEDWRVISPT